MTTINHCYQFNLALSNGAFAWPGGYPFYFITADGGALSFKAAQENAGLVRDAIISQDKHSGWCVCAVDVNWEDKSLTCDHTGDRIESAYGDDDEDENKYTNHYRHCGQEWSDTWSCMCNDACPVCGTEIEPYDSEENDAEDAPQFVAGWNMPGYMPDSEPAEFATFDDAKRYIIDELKREEENADSEDDAEKLAAFAEDINLQSSEFGATCGKYHYFVTKV